MVYFKWAEFWHRTGYRSRDFVRAGRGDAPSQDRERGAWQDRRALSNRNTSIM